MEKDLKDLRVGREFEAKEVIEAKASYLREKTKTMIVMFVLLGVAVAFSFGLYESLKGDSYQPVRNVWMVVSNLLFLVIGLYFGRKFASAQSHDESST